VNCRGYVVLNGRMIVDDELERIWEEVVVAFFKTLSWKE
jgi:hypothetical protein